MSWQDDAEVIIRNLVGDVDEPQTYTSDRLEELSCVAARQVACEIPALAAVYRVDLGNVDITPDPTARSDQSFVNLFCLKARLTILEGEAKKAAGQAISIKDGASAVDLREIAQQKRLLADQAKADYEQAKLEYKLGSGAAAGHAVVGPIRLYLGHCGWDRSY
jgi:hypothetical protein